MSDAIARERVLEDVRNERRLQDVQWGDQNHPDGTGRLGDKQSADAARESCDVLAESGRVTWRDILAEEFREALAESEPDKLRAELVQVAAVAVNWIEAIDRRSTE